MPRRKPRAVLISPDRVRAIQSIVAARYAVRAADLTGPKSPRNISQPRAVAMTLARKLTSCSYPLIGHFFGRHHTTVIAAERHVTRQAENDPDLRALLISLEQEIGAKR